MFNRCYKYLLCLGIALCVSFIVSAAVPSGYYYFAKNKKQAALKTALHDYCAPMQEFDYGGGPGFTWEGFFYTDNRNDTVIDMYSNTIRKFNGFSAVNGMHIEHSFPKSWWGAYPNGAYKDLFHLYPADATTNITKSNLPLGEVTGTPTLNNGVTKIGPNGFGTAYTDNCFEPADEYKGDFARSYFYISTIYENYAQLWASPMLNNNTYPVWKPWAIDLLLKWHRQDPVSGKERARVEAIYNLQGNRNPFIDYPDLAEHIWGKDTTTIYPFPVETEPFLLTPRRGATVDFGVILASDVRSKNLHIQGVNINANVQVSLLHNNPALTLSTPLVTATDVLTGLDLGITFTPQAAGLVNDTLLVQGGGLTDVLRIPIKALASADLITLEPTEISPVGGTLQWISDPQATDYKLNVYQGDSQAGDLIISTYVEGSSWNKAIELFNGTGRTINLANYELRKQSDGAGAFGSALQLSGTLPNNSSYVIVHRKCSTADLLAKAQVLDTLVLNINGNDAIALMRNGVTIDMVGQANAGADVVWGLDATLQRKSTVTHPSSNFVVGEWTSLPMDSYAMLGSHAMTLPGVGNYVLQNVSTGKVTSYAIQNLLPENTYTYKVEAVKSGGNTAAINTMQVHTATLDIPILMQATQVNTTEFTTNWEETLYASGYLLNLFEVSGQPEVVDLESFGNIGTSGAPTLPTGWTGNATGIYTSTTSSGIAPPSVNLKATGEWLQTKAYALPVTNLTFMYRFASTSTGSAVVVDGLSDMKWTRVDSVVYKNTTKTNPIYTFTKDKKMSAFRFKFYKAGSGNLAIDDVQAKYGSLDTTYVLRDAAIMGTQLQVANLKANSNYLYNVRATLGSSVSLPSETIGVKTLTANGVTESKLSTIKIESRNDQIRLWGLQGSARIEIYTATGLCLKFINTNSNEISIPFNRSGLFIVRVHNNQQTSAYKIIR